jgi:hypothetical protein
VARLHQVRPQQLGGGHFDPDDRRRWQQEFNELSRKTEVDGEPWLSALGLTLVRSLIISVEGSGIVLLLGGRT